MLGAGRAPEVRLKTTRTDHRPHGITEGRPARARGHPAAGGAGLGTKFRWVAGGETSSRRPAADLARVTLEEAHAFQERADALCRDRMSCGYLLAKAAAGAGLAHGDMALQLAMPWEAYVVLCKYPAPPAERWTQELNRLALDLPCDGRALDNLLRLGEEVIRETSSRSM